MRSKWITFASAGTLGIFLAASKSTLSEEPPTSKTTPPASTNLTTTLRAAATSPDSARAGELLKKAIIELRAERFDAARSLAKQAAEFEVTYSVFDVRPEHVLSEISRREQNFVPAANQTAALTKTNPGDSNPFADGSNPFAETTKAITQTSSHSPAAVVDDDPVTRAADAKIRAIETLEQGLLAVDENRLDDAERLATQALSMHVAWDPFDYRPENLLAEIKSHKANAAADTKDASVFDFGDKLTDLPGKSTDAAAASVTLGPAAGRPAGAPRAAAKLLTRAIDDLHAGRTDSARLMIGRALELIPAPTSQPPVESPKTEAARPADALTPATNDRTPATNHRAVPKKVTVAAKPASDVPAMSSAGRSDRRAQTQEAMDALDETLLPIHDRFLGDAPSRTRNSDAGEKRFRESLSGAEPITPAATPKYPASAASDRRVRPVGYEIPTQGTSAESRVSPPPRLTARDAVRTGDGSFARMAAKSPPGVPATTADGSAISPQIGWLEKMSAPLGIGPGPANRSVVDPHGADHRHGRPAPIAPPIATDGKWSTPGRAPYIAPEEKRPGVFRRMWNSLRGEK